MSKIKDDMALTKIALWAVSEHYRDLLHRTDALANKLYKIKTICNEVPTIDSELSLRILEVIEGEDEE